jgi:hypothetical protein
MYLYVFVAGSNKHDVLLISRVPTNCEILTSFPSPLRVNLPLYGPVGITFGPIDNTQRPLMNIEAMCN